MPVLLSLVQKSLYTELVKAAEECTVWSTVEGVRLQPFQMKLLRTGLKAVQAGLPEDQISTALQIGEIQGQFQR